ncbi:MAG: AMP-binding protein, partial [bacterium]|nr:AMP-binding protein [bacterium]
SLSYFVVPRPAVSACAQEREHATLPLGRGIRDVELLVLGPAGRLAGIGELGEIHVRSPHLALGYLDDEALTRERFLPNPFGDDPGDRLYRTGDLGRYLPDGNVEFAGRVDHQVQIRGYRIELGEIEAVLGRHPGVRECAVAVRGRGAERRLVAYTVAATAAAAATAEGPAESALREHLTQQLPEYMVPSAFVFLEALPLTPTGKLDRRALPEPEGPAADFAAPRSGEEEIVAAIWGDLLGRRQVGLDDNFFDLGGHSLVATQVVSRIRETFGVELALRRLFEAPTLAELAAVVRALRDEQQGVVAPPMVPVDRDHRGLPRTAVPLSFAQQRLWFLDQFEPASPLYNLPHALRLDGAVSPAVLARVFAELVRRHEVLRTTFAMEEGRPRQVIAAQLRLPLPLVDLTRLPEPERDAEARRLATAEAQLPFDLTRGPLLRVTLLQWAAESHLVLMTIHHIVADGWSFGVFLNEVAALYEAFSQDHPAGLPELPIQYADYAVWQRQWLAGEVLEAELGYWREQLAGVPQRLELPTDRPRPVMQTFPGRLIPVPVSEEVAGRLPALTRQHAATPFMTLLAAFAALLRRWTGQTDVVAGTPIAGRIRREIEPLVGFFVNTLLLRTDLGGDPDFRRLLAQVRQVALDGYAHQVLPFERLVEELAPERDLGSNPLFQVMFALQNAPRGSAELSDLVLSPLPAQQGTAKFDLTLFMSETGVDGRLEYNTDLFDATTMERFAAHFARLLGGIVEDPERRLSELPLVSAAERHQLLEAWNDTAAALPQVAGVAELFGAQALRTPERLALVFADEQWSYRELERRSNRLAHHLRDWGVGPEVAVGVAIERSVDLVAAMLGILKSGGFVVPLDRSLPAERLAFIIEESGVEVILTRRDSHQHLPDHRARTLLLDDESEAIARQPSASPARAVTAENLAYVIYTSGTTGRPKGISLIHRTLTNLTAWQLRATAPDAGLRTSQFAPLSFDVSFQETFSTLGAGGTLVVLTEEVRRDAVLLVDRLERHRIERLYLPFIALQQLCEAAADSPPPSLREVITAGEQLQITRALERFFTAAACILENQYGPSETHVVTCYPLRGAPREWTALPPIGRGIGNFRTYVVDSRLHPVPMGVAGEVCLSGVGMARGYLSRPELTAATFLPDPWSDEPGERLYR